MGKPIAGQDQFPYTVGGFLVDGANINGVTYAKKLYIYKQRSYDTYDLQDTNGNIFRFIKIVYQDVDGNMLNYFDVDEELVLTIPENTFFLKIQDPSRNIFSFVRIYQWHKCITVEGDYVFRTADIDPRLSGVLINPIISTIPVGNTLSYKSLFYPSSYANVDGTWYMNSIDGLRDNTNAEIISSNLNTALVKGLSLGKAVLSFVPKANDALVTHSIINVVQNSQPVSEFAIKSVLPYTTYKDGDEYVLEVVTYPYDAVLTEPLDFKITEGWNNSTTTTLISVSDDFKKYTFKTVLSELPPPELEEGEDPYEEPDWRMENVQFTATMSSPIEYQYLYGDVMICSEYMYNNNYEFPGKIYYPPRGLRPNMTWQCTAEIQGPNQTIYPYVSSDPDIATLDYQTGILTTHNKTGEVTFSTQYDKVDGSGVGTTTVMTLTVREDMYDRILCEPQEVDVMNPGETLTVTFTGIRSGQPDVNIPVDQRVFGQGFSISPTGLVTVFDNAPIGGTVYVRPDVTLDYQVIATYNSTGIQPTIRKPDDLVPVSSLESNYTTYYVRYSEYEHVNFWENIIVWPRPSRCSGYKMQFESYDDTVVEIIDKDQVTDIQSYAMGGSLYFYVKGLKRGSTEMVISSVDNPSIKMTFKIVVY